MTSNIDEFLKFESERTEAPLKAGNDSLRSDIIPFPFGDEKKNDNDTVTCRLKKNIEKWICNVSDTSVSYLLQMLKRLERAITDDDLNKFTLSKLDETLERIKEDKSILDVLGFEYDSSSQAYSLEIVDCEDEIMNKIKLVRYVSESKSFNEYSTTNTGTGTGTSITSPFLLGLNSEQTSNIKSRRSRLSQYDITLVQVMVLMTGDDEYSIETKNELIDSVLLHLPYITTSEDFWDVLRDRFDYNDNDNGRGSISILTFGDVMDTEYSIEDCTITNNTCNKPGSQNISNKAPIHVPQSVEVSLTNTDFIVSSRVLNILKKWITDYYVRDFRDNPGLRENIHTFIEDKIKELKVSDLVKSKIENRILYLNIIKKCFSTQKILETKKRRRDTFSNKVLGINNNDSPARFKSITFMELPNELIAQQLTLLDFKLFCKIKPTECINGNWKKKNGRELSPNIMDTIDDFNNKSKWVKWCILEIKNDINSRQRMIKKFIKIAEILKENRNYQSLLPIVSALNSTDISPRVLKKTWETHKLGKGLKNKHIQSLNTLKNFQSVNDNFAILRRAQKVYKGPTIPYIGILLNDLFLNKNIKKKMKTGDLINFKYLIKNLELINNHFKYKDLKYRFKDDYKIQGFLKSEIKLCSKIKDSYIYNYAKNLET